VLITNNQGTFHPIHLHGHDFHVVAQKELETFDPATFTPKTDHAPRRDVAMLPLGGYLVIAFQTDNPGAWLLHCHIGWHASQGFAATFLERLDEIKKTIDVGRLDQGCSDWKTFAKAKGIVQHDSGI
jgi:FtsP/CotA-like multicopper oxidase with cupredoxin domain